MGASAKSLAGTLAGPFAVLGLAAWLGGCAVGSFDLGRGTSTASAPPAPAPMAGPGAEPNPGTYTPPPTHAAHAPPPQQPTQAAPDPATYQPPPAAQQTPQQLPAGRAARTPVIPAESAAEAEPDVLTTQRAREQCWMASESTKFARNLDQKVKWVEKCVNGKMRTVGQ